nr:hypothetical protein [Tanacetum cinerariifolium]
GGGGMGIWVTMICRYNTVEDKEGLQRSVMGMSEIDGDVVDDYALAIF